MRSYLSPISDLYENQKLNLKLERSIAALSFGKYYIALLDFHVKHLPYNATFLHGICGANTLMIRYKKLYCSISNKVILLYLRFRIIPNKRSTMF